MKFFSHDRPKRQPTRSSGRRSTSRKLQMQPLEDRIVLSTFAVVNTLDDGAGSLRQAILDANAQPGSDTITFAPGGRGTIALSSELVITDDVTIKGPGEHQLTVSGEGASRVFSVVPDLQGNFPTATFQKLTIANGFATDAPGFPVETGFGWGGGIYNLGATVELDRVTVTDNVASAFSIAAGGGVANEFGGTLIVDRSHFANNSAVGIAVGTGGAIGSSIGPTADPMVSTGPPTLIVSHSSFSSNSAISLQRDFDPDLNPFAGFTLGGAIGNFSGLASINHSQFYGNEATSGPGVDDNDGGDAFGGAIFSMDFSPFGFADATLDVSHSSFSHNAARGGEGGLAGGNGGRGIGGAVTTSIEFFGNSGTLSYTVFQHNLAVGGEGGASSGDGGDGKGGGIANLAGAVLNVEHVKLIHNQARGGAGGPDGGNGGNGQGGAIGVDILDLAGFESRLPSVNVANSRFVANEAVGGEGDIDGGSGGDGLGGGLSVSRGGTATVMRSSFSNNAAAGGNGGLAGSGGNGQGGGLYNGDASTTSLARSFVFANWARRGLGGAGGVDGVGQGGGIYNAASGVFEIDAFSDFRVRFNNASDGGDDVFGTLTLV